jgi:hypothetical protein
LTWQTGAACADSPDIAVIITVNAAANFAFNPVRMISIPIPSYSF